MLGAAMQEAREGWSVDEKPDWKNHGIRIIRSGELDTNTPQTRGMMAAREFRLMKKTAFLINIGRGACVVLDDLVAALQAGEIAGAGLDVYELEPLPSNHPLWTMPGVLLTPHVAGVGPYLPERRTEIVIENCRRFNAGRPLHNVVDKANWF